MVHLGNSVLFPYVYRNVNLCRETDQRKVLCVNAQVSEWGATSVTGWLQVIFLAFVVYYSTDLYY